MKKFILATTLAGLMAGSAFAGVGGGLGGGSDGSTSKNPVTSIVAKHLTFSTTDTCILDNIGTTLTNMVNHNLKESVITFASGANVKKTLQNLQKNTCSKTSGISITTQDNLVVVTRSTSNPDNNYTFKAWYKDHQAVCAILSPDYEIE